MKKKVLRIRRPYDNDNFEEGKKNEEKATYTLIILKTNSRHSLHMKYLLLYKIKQRNTPIEENSEDL